MLTNYLNIKDTLKDGSADQFYENMYADSTEKEDTFNFPFFGDNVRSFSNTFGDTFQNGIGGGGGLGSSPSDFANEMMGLGAQLAGTIGSDAISKSIGQVKVGDTGGAIQTIKTGMSDGGNPGTYIETPMFYQFEKNDGPLEVTFMLYNTINDDNDKNYQLIKHLTKINRPLRKSSISVDPPRIFKVYVPGHRLIRWASCASFGVNLMGARRLIPIDGNDVIVPEAYQITMSFQSLTLEHAGFIDNF